MLFGCLHFSIVFQNIKMKTLINSRDDNSDLSHVDNMAGNKDSELSQEKKNHC